MFGLPNPLRAVPSVVDGDDGTLAEHFGHLDIHYCNVIQEAELMQRPARSNPRADVKLLEMCHTTCTDCSSSVRLTAYAPQHLQLSPYTVDYSGNDHLAVQDCK